MVEFAKLARARARPVVPSVVQPTYLKLGLIVALGVAIEEVTVGVDEVVGETVMIVELVELLAVMSR